MREGGRVRDMGVGFVGVVVGQVWRLWLVVHELVWDRGDEKRKLQW